MKELLRLITCSFLLLAQKKRTKEKGTTKTNRKLLLVAQTALHGCKTSGSHFSWTSPHRARIFFYKAVCEAMDDLERWSRGEVRWLGCQGWHVRKQPSQGLNRPLFWFLFSKKRN